MIDWTVANVFGEPPPKSKVALPIGDAAASWTGAASEPAGATVPVARSMMDTVDREEPDGVMPPSTVRPPVLATTASREIGAFICQGSTPASMEAIPTGCAAVAPPAAAVVVGAAVEPPLEHEAKAIPPTSTAARTARAAARHRGRCMRCAREDRLVTVTESGMAGRGPGGTARRTGGRTTPVQPPLITCSARRLISSSGTSSM